MAVNHRASAALTDQEKELKVLQEELKRHKAFEKYITEVIEIFLDDHVEGARPHVSS